MRSRGAKTTDIIVLVVAADDGVKPQTIESIWHSKAAKVPIIVAINMIDLPSADPDKVRKDLLNHEIIVEKLSGDVLDVELSALKKLNLDKKILCGVPYGGIPFASILSYNLNLPLILLRKKEKEYGTKQISLWRRDYLTKPPPISRNDIEKLLKKRIFKKRKNQN